MTEIVITLRAPLDLLLAIRELTTAINAHTQAIETQKAPPPGLTPPGSVLAAKNGDTAPKAPKPAVVVPQSPIAAGIPIRKRSNWYTEERRQLLRELYPSRATGSEIMAALSKLPGPPLPDYKTVQVYAIGSLRLKRSEPRGPKPEGFRIGAGTAVETQHVP